MLFFFLQPTNQPTNQPTPLRRKTILRPFIPSLSFLARTFDLRPSLTHQKLCCLCHPPSCLSLSHRSSSRRRPSFVTRTALFTRQRGNKPQVLPNPKKTISRTRHHAPPSKNKKKPSSTTNQTIAPPSVRPSVRPSTRPPPPRSPAKEKFLRAMTQRPKTCALSAVPPV